MMIFLKTGQPYPLPTPSQEGASANFLSKNGNTLQVNISNLTKDELYALKKGKIKAGFLYEKGDLLWLFAFYGKKGPLFTLDAPFDVRIIPKDLLALHNITSEQQRLSIDIHVVDSGILRGLRSITMPHDLTVSFLAAAQDQYANLQSGQAQEKWARQDLTRLIEKTKLFVLGE